jgi:ATP-dependent DNA helicase DinG
VPDPVTSTLRAVTGALPGGGEEREGQEAMAEAVATAMAEGRHLVVQAGTGIGKSLAYLVPAALGGGPTVVATATKALQDQLADKDLPAVAAATDVDLTFAVLKGRSNYLCRQRLTEMGGGTQLDLVEPAPDPPDKDDRLRPARDAPATPGTLGEQVRRLVAWSEVTTSGDRAELDFEPHYRAWAAVSTSARECPGAFRCPSGHECFAEDARHRAAESDVIVVNTHLYGAHLASGGTVLPPHRVVVFDEAHAVEDVLTDGLGVEIGPGRFRALAAGARALLDDSPAAKDTADAVAETADALETVLAPLVGHRLVTATTDSEGDAPEPRETVGVRAAQRDLDGVLAMAAGRVGHLSDRLRNGSSGDGDDPTIRSRRDRLLLAAGHLSDDLARFTAPSDDEVAWVDSDARSPVLRLSPIDIGPQLAERLWPQVTGILTSATVPLGLDRRLGLPAGATDVLDVGSPFDYRDQAMLYVARDLPDRRRPEAEAAIHEELVALIDAAGGRTLALFTSWRAMRAAVEVLRARIEYPIYAQSDLPKPALIDAFAGEEGACLFATLGFWQGVDVPGPTLTLVTIDRIPFPRPDDPVLEARRERAGAGAFGLVDLPRAATLLAQGAGRLIRSSRDRGVVAVLDSRLATARYRGDLLARVPPMRRSVDRAEVEAFLRSLRIPSTPEGTSPGTSQGTSQGTPEGTPASAQEIGGLRAAGEPATRRR